MGSVQMLLVSPWRHSNKQGLADRIRHEDVFNYTRISSTLQSKNYTLILKLGYHHYTGSNTGGHT